MKPIEDFIYIKTVYWDEEYTEDGRAYKKAKALANQQKHNRAIARRDHRYRNKQRSFK